jgi:hypothetical protein
VDVFVGEADVGDACHFRTGSGGALMLAPRTSPRSCAASYSSARRRLASADRSCGNFLPA